MAKNYIYFISPSIYNCAYSLSVNGIEFFKRNNGMALGSSIPINEWMINGLNLINIKIKTLEEQETLGPDTLANVAIIEQAKDGPPDYIERKVFDPGQHDNQKNKTNFELNFQVLNKNVFKKVSWFEDGITIPLDIEIEKAISSAHEIITYIYDAFFRKDTSSIIELMKPRSIEAMNLMFHPIEDYIKLQKKALSKNFNNSDKILQPLNWLNFRPKIYAAGKLIAFEDSNGKHPIQFINEKQGSISDFPLYFYFTEDQKCQLIR